MPISQSVTVLPTPPSRADPDNFDARADGFLGALPTMMTQMNTWAGQANSTATTVNDDKLAAQSAKTGAESARDTASGHASTAAGHASTATTQAGTATTQAGIATTQAGIATTQAGIATTQAGTATTQAGTATTQAGIATTQAGLAATAKTNAETAESHAETAQGLAEAARDTAAGHASTATTQAGTATTQAGIAAGHASTATTQAGTATTQAGIATTQAGIATTQAGIATTQAGLADTARQAAEDARDDAVSIVYGETWPVGVSMTEVGYLDGVTSAIQAQLNGKAASAAGVTNGDSHDHSGGDGAQIAYANLSGLPTLGTAAATASTDYAPAANGVTNGNSHNHDGGDGAQIAYSSLSGTPNLGTAAAKNIPSTGNASATEVVYGSDTRLSDPRTPASHTTASHSDWPAAVSMTELGYLDGVTSALQTQLNTRVPMLTADLSLYVATTGNDSNSGTSSGSPFLTIQKAIDVATGYHLSIYDITINIAAGTYDTDTAVFLKSYATGGGIIILSGSLTTPANHILTNTSSSYNGTVIYADSCGTYRLEGLKLVCDASGYVCLRAIGAALLYLKAVDFGLASLAHIRAINNAVISNDGGYTVSSSVTSGSHIDVRAGGVATGSGLITLSGTPAWGLAFVYADVGGVALLASYSFSGSATGARYSARAGGSVLTLGGEDFLPGDSAGSVISGGIYA